MKRNRVLEMACVGVLLVTAVAPIAWACDDEEEVTTAQVGRWQISSSEVVGEEDATSRRFPHFKLAHLMDNDDATPWVFRGAGKKNTFAPTWGKRHALQFDRDTPVEIDEVRLMNGYNKRRDLFWRNDRIVEIGIAADGKKIKTAVLSDKMGWHSVSIPRGKMSSVVIEMISVRKGRGKDNDLCISELAFYNRGKRIKP